MMNRRLFFSAIAAPAAALPAVTLESTKAKEQLAYALLPQCAVCGDYLATSYTTDHTGQVVACERKECAQYHKYLMVPAMLVDTTLATPVEAAHRQSLEARALEQG